MRWLPRGRMAQPRPLKRSDQRREHPLVPGQGISRGLIRVEGYGS